MPYAQAREPQAREINNAGGRLQFSYLFCRRCQHRQLNLETRFKQVKTQEIKESSLVARWQHNISFKNVR